MTISTTMRSLRTRQEIALVLWEAYRGPSHQFEAPSLKEAADRLKWRPCVRLEGKYSYEWLHYYCASARRTALHDWINDARNNYELIQLCQHGSPERVIAIGVPHSPGCND